MSNKNKSMDYQKGIRAFDVIGYIYLFAIFGVYPWFMTNKYFNITITRYRFFMWATVFYILFVIAARIIDKKIMEYYKIKTELFDWQVFNNTKKAYQNPFFWIEAFALANMFSFFLANDRNNAANGSQGRFMGLWFFLCALLVLLLLRIKIKEGILLIFEAATLYAAFACIYQHLEPVLKNTFLKALPFAHYRDNINPKVYTIFLSTFGNINILASFLAMAIPVLLCIFVYTKRSWHRIVSGVVLFFASMIIMVANSDSAYLGISVAVLVLFFRAFMDDKLTCFLGGIVVILGGYFTMTMLNYLVLEDYDKRGGFAETLDKPGLVFLALFLAGLLLVAWLLAEHLWMDKIKKINKKKVCIAIALMLALTLVVFVFVGIRKNMSLFTFNYKWGTYRGYIWSKCAEIFGDAGPVRKLFGYGQESLEAIMRSRYNDEMISVTKKVYDNAHNELLQYLITTGLLGMVSYIGLFFSSVFYIGKRAAKRVLANACMVAMIGYFSQALININQPITTPFFFVFMALGIGYVRDERNQEDT